MGPGAARPPPPPQEAPEPSGPRPWAQPSAEKRGAGWEGRGPCLGDWPATGQARDPAATPELAGPWEESPGEGRPPLRHESQATRPRPRLGVATGAQPPEPSGRGGVLPGSEAALAGRPPRCPPPPLLSGGPRPSEKRQQQCLFSSDIFKKNSFPQMLDLASGMWGGQQLSAPQTPHSPGHGQGPGGLLGDAGRAWGKRGARLWAPLPVSLCPQQGADTPRPAAPAGTAYFGRGPGAQGLGFWDPAPGSTRHTPGRPCAPVPAGLTACAPLAASWPDTLVLLKALASGKPSGELSRACSWGAAGLPRQGSEPRAPRPCARGRVSGSHPRVRTAGGSWLADPCPRRLPKPSLARGQALALRWGPQPWVSIRLPRLVLPRGCPLSKRSPVPGYGLPFPRRGAWPRGP